MSEPALEPSVTGTVVLLEHEHLEDPVAYAAGWHTHLDLLADYATGRPRSFDRFRDDYEELVQRYRRHLR